MRLPVTGTTATVNRSPRCMLAIVASDQNCFVPSLA
jgi:hypothetical protein